MESLLFRPFPLRFNLSFPAPRPVIKSNLSSNVLILVPFPRGDETPPPPATCTLNRPHPSLSIHIYIHTYIQNPYIYIYKPLLNKLYSSLSDFRATHQVFDKMSKIGTLLVLSFVLVFSVIASANRDPEKELEQCQIQCGKLSRFDRRQVQECRDKCERYYREKHREGEEERGRRGGDSNPEDPFERLRKCEGKCLQKRDERERSECHRDCQEEFQKEREREEEREGRRGGGGRGENPREPEEEEKIRECRDKCKEDFERKDQREKCEYKCSTQQRESESRGGDVSPRYEGDEREEQSKREQEGEPYVFQDQHFSTKFQTDHGSVRILQRFNKRELLCGIENFRVEIFEANPHTFIVPSHRDADTIIFVNQGRATISLVCQDKRESFNVQQGDVLKIQAGTTVYMVNPDKNEKLVMVKLIHPVSVPGHFEAFFGPGGENPESFFRAFSSVFLEAAFNIKGDTFEKVFQQQRKGVIIKASEEQIRGMSQHEEGGIWPFGSESKGPYNLFKHEPSQSNQHGKFYEAGPSEFGDLRELDLGVAFASISRGSMMTPMFNSRATKIAIVVRGKGDLEIACPHLSSSESSQGKEGKKGQHGGGSSHQRQTTPSYQRVRANLRSGTVYVIPAGHPFITVASPNENLEVVCFNVKAQNNEKVQLAGRKNIFNHFERDAKELAFGVSEQEVDEVFKSQKEEFFVKWPHPQHESRAYA